MPHHYRAATYDFKVTLLFLFFFVFLAAGCSNGSKTTTAFGTKQLSAPDGNTFGRRISTDANGNIYVVGGTKGGLDRNTSTGYESAFIAKYDKSWSKMWTRQLGATNGNTEVHGAATDSQGNTYITGYTYGALEGITQVGLVDAFVAMYDSSGTRQWIRQLGATGSRTFAYGITIDKDENIYITGSTRAGLEGNSQTGDLDVFISKYDSSGTLKWARQIGATGKLAFGKSVAVDANKNIYITGYTYGGLDGQVQTGIADTFLIKYDESGNRQWTEQFGVTDQGTDAIDMTTDISGQYLYIIGSTSGGLNGNTQIGENDGFIIKYDNSGNKLWSRQFGVPGKDLSPGGISVDTNGSLYITGSINGKLDGQTQTGETDAFVIKYSNTGNKQWTRQFGTPDNETRGIGIDYDKNGSIYITGTIDDTQTKIDVFVVKYSTTGRKQ